MKKSMFEHMFDGTTEIVNDALPKVIKEGKLKPTTCFVCHSVYQAKIKHLRIIYALGKHVAHCPVCGADNVAEFETDEANTEVSGE